MADQLRMFSVFYYSYHTILIENSMGYSNYSPDEVFKESKVILNIVLIHFSVFDVSEQETVNQLLRQLADNNCYCTELSHLLYQIAIMSFEKARRKVEHGPNIIAFDEKRYMLLYLHNISFISR